MNIEELLHSISHMLKKNKDFFDNNAELAKTVETRFYKAFYDGDEDDDAGYFGESQQFDDMFDKPDAEVYTDEYGVPIHGRPRLDKYGEPVYDEYGEPVYDIDEPDMFDTEGNPVLHDYAEEDLYSDLQNRTGRDFSDKEGGTDVEDFRSKGYDETMLTEAFDDLPQQDVDENQDGEISEQEGAEWLEENPEVIDESFDIDGDGDLDIPPSTRKKLETQDKESDEAYAEQTASQGRKSSRGRLRDWTPQAEYKQEHQDLIDKYMKEGYTHREAETLAGASSFIADPWNSEIKGKWKVKRAQNNDKMR